MRLFLRDDGEDLRSLGVEIGRAFAGALLFSLPMLMTMELWWLGFTMPPDRLALFVAAFLPLIYGLSRIAGLRPTATRRDDAADAAVAVLVGVAASTAILFLFGALDLDTPWREAVGKIAVQAVPAAMGAILARSQLGGQSEEDAENPARSDPSFGREMFEMVVGALYLSLNVAPTEEMVLIAHQATPGKVLALALLSISLMHAVVYSTGFAGGSGYRPGSGFVSVFLRYTLTGYVLVLLVSLALLWVFGRTDDTAASEIAGFAVVLAFPGALGAAVARLIL